MRFKMILAGLLILTSLPVVAQVVPQANESISPFYVGGGYSRFSPDWGPGRTLDGLNAYAGIAFPKLTRIPKGLGIEAEWRDLFFHPSINNPLFVSSEMTMGGGLIYKYSHFQKFRPYGKFFYELGKVHYKDYVSAPNGIAYLDEYAYDTVTVMGGGVEYKVKSHYWLRADYSYETYPSLFLQNKNLNPVGVTLGMTYNFTR